MRWIVVVKRLGMSVMGLLEVGVEIGVHEIEWPGVVADEEKNHVDEVGFGVIVVEAGAQEAY